MSWTLCRMSNANLIEIFKAGKHTASNGASLSFTEEDLQATADAYNPAIHEAPIVVGHPQDNAPAYGWVSKLNFSDGALQAEPAQVDPEFAEIVKQGRFKKVSASFYTPDASSNPVPGVFYLRHVGFLGAQPPAVKGLRQFSFAHSGDGIVEFGAYEDVLQAGLWRRLREWLIGKFGIETADSVLPNYEIQSIEAKANQPDPQPDPAAQVTQAFQETKPVTDKQATNDIALESQKLINDQAAVIAQQNAELAQFKERVARIERTAIEARIAGLVEDEKILPAQAPKLLEFALRLPESDSIEFSDGSKSNLRDALFELVSSAGGARIGGAGQHLKADFAESVPGMAVPAGFGVDQTGLQLRAKALKRAAETGVSFSEALSQLITEGEA